jgi:Fur family ferric uptake transcriptional regulator
MTNDEIIYHLEQKGVKSTINRILVMKTLMECHHPVTLSYLEQELGTMDKSSIFRVLSLFLEHDVVHAFEDGQGILNYEVCEHSGLCDMSDAHIHFYCEKCKKTSCLNEISIHELNLPEGYTSHSLSFVVKGLCPKCQK